MDIFTCKDINGETVDIDYSVLMKEFSSGGMTIYGMGMKEIGALRKQYMLKGGVIPITKERIIEVFEGKPECNHIVGFDGTEDVAEIMRADSAKGMKSNDYWSFCPECGEKITKGEEGG